ncbi:disks large-associated protein 5 isoform X2 [Lissotriton helveticus]
MEAKSQYTTRYKKDLSTETLRAKVARRKSLTQKENRHKEFRKSRRLALADINMSPVKEIDLSTLGSNEDSVFKKDVNTTQKLAKQRLDLLQRFKEEKQLRKLTEQREQARRGIFKCGTYKHDAPLPSFPQMQQAVQVKPEKVAPLSESRVTRSMARPNSNKTVRTQKLHQSMVNQSFSGYKANPDRLVQPARTETAASKKRTEKENLVLPTTLHTRTTRVPVALHTRTTRVPVAVATRPASNRTIVTTGKPVQKLSTGIPQRKTDPKEKSKVIHSKIVDTKAVKLQKPVEKISREPSLQWPDLAFVEPMENKNTTQKMQEPSFAPLNFQFQPLDGISTIKLNPMTPHSTNAFFNPCFTWSPAKTGTVTKISDAMDEGGDVPVCPLSPVSVSNQSAESTSSLSTTEPEGPSEVQQKAEPAAELSIPVSETLVIEEIMSKPDENKHDVPYFRDTLRLEIERLTSLCVQWEQSTELTDVEIPEDAKALIRTTVGQTRLLMTERFKQFEGLVDDCEFKRGEKETTCTDLDGFWDMVNFQIEDVLKKFTDLDRLKENAWQQVNIQAKKVKKKIAPVAASKPNQGDNARAAARNRLAAIKAAMKNKMKQEDVLPETSETQAAKDSNTVVFDAGFFKVESPAKSIQRSSSKVRKSSLSQSIGAKLEGSVSKVPDLHSIETVCFSSGPPEHLSETETSPNPLLNTVKKVLFGSTDNLQSVSGADEVCPMVEELDPTSLSFKAESADVEQLPANVICTPGPNLPRSDDSKPATDDPEGDVIESLECPKMQADVMCSPLSTSVTMTEESEMLEIEKPDWVPRNMSLEICHDPLDFLRRQTPPTQAKFLPAELASELPPAVEANDLIVFSPVTM